MPYSIFIVNLILIALTLIISNSLLAKTTNGKEKFFVFALSFLLCSYTFNLRPEIFIFPFLLLLLHLMNQYKMGKKYAPYIAILTAIIGLIHPVGGFYAVFFITAFFWENKLPFIKLVFFGFYIVGAVAILYGPVVFKDVQLWQLNFFHRGFENDSRYVSLDRPLKFLSYSLPLVVIIAANIFTVNRNKILREILLLVTLIVLLVFFARSYYYLYLFHFILWRLAVNERFHLNKFLKLSYVAAFCVNLLLVYLFPPYQLLENKSFGSLFKQASVYVRETVVKNPDKQIWISPLLAMNGIDKRNSRLFLSNYQSLSDTTPSIDTSVIFLVTSAKDIATVQSYPINKNDSFAVEQIFQPIPGLIHIGLRTERSDSLALWSVKIITRHL